MVRTKTNRDMFDNVFGLPNLFKSYIYLYTDNDLQEVEAHSGDTINQVKVAVQGCLNYGPDVVLINANERLPSASRHSKHGIAHEISDQRSARRQWHGNKDNINHYTFNGGQHSCSPHYRQRTVPSTCPRNAKWRSLRRTCRYGSGDFHRGLKITIISQCIYARRSRTGLDMVNAVSVPILMIHQVIVSMQEVIGTAEEIDTKMWKRQILFFLSAFLSFILIGGEVIGAINGLASIGWFVALADEASIVGMGLYSVVNDPSSAPFLIFGYVLSADARTDAVKVNKAA